MNRHLGFAASAMLWVVMGTALARADDAYVHPFTGFTFPPKVVSFTQVKVTPFNEAHSDIEVDYNNDPFTVHLSVYVYPAHDPLQKHYEQCKADVMQIHPDARLLEEKPVAFTKGGVKFEGFSALYTFQGKFIANKEQDLLSKLIVFRRGDYYVLYRISYATDDKIAAEKQIDDFLQQFDWPAGDGRTLPDAASASHPRPHDKPPTP